MLGLQPPFNPHVRTIKVHIFFCLPIFLDFFNFSCTSRGTSHLELPTSTRVPTIGPPCHRCAIVNFPGRCTCEPFFVPAATRSYTLLYSDPGSPPPLPTCIFLLQDLQPLLEYSRLPYIAVGVSPWVFKLFSFCLCGWYWVLNYFGNCCYLLFNLKFYCPLSCIF